MFDLTAIAIVLLAVTGMGSAILFLVFMRHSRRSRRRKVVNNDQCYMCRRPTPVTEMHSWHIRHNEQLVCSRCHPFYKQRFGRPHSHHSEEHEDMTAVSP